MADASRSLADRVKAIIAEAFAVKPDQLHDHEQLAALGADSLDVLEAVMDIEMEFAIAIDDDALERFVTVGDVVACVERALKDNTAQAEPRPEVG